MEEQEWLDIYKDICFPKNIVVSYEDDKLAAEFSGNANAKIVMLMAENQKIHEQIMNTLNRSNLASELGSFSHLLSLDRPNKLSYPVLVEVRTTWGNITTRPETLWYSVRLHSGRGVTELNEKFKEGCND